MASSGNHFSSSTTWSLDLTQVMNPFPLNRFSSQLVTCHGKEIIIPPKNYFYLYLNSQYQTILK